MQCTGCCCFFPFSKRWAWDVESMGGAWILGCVPFVSSLCCSLSVSCCSSWPLFLAIHPTHNAVLSLLFSRLLQKLLFSKVGTHLSKRTNGKNDNAKGRVTAPRARASRGATMAESPRQSPPPIRPSIAGGQCYWAPPLIRRPTCCGVFFEFAPSSRLFFFLLCVRVCRARVFRDRSVAVSSNSYPI